MTNIPTRLTEQQALMEQVGVTPQELKELFKEAQPHGPLTPKLWIHKTTTEEQEHGSQKSSSKAP